MRNIGKKKTSRVKEIVWNHITNNIRSYSIAIILFLIGLIFGIIFINNAGQTQVEEITSYIGEFVQNLQNNVEVDKAQLLKESLISNLLVAFAFWFMGSTVIGMPIVYGMIAYRGFCLGYTISSVIASLGIGKRNSIFYYFDFVPKYYIYSLHFSFSC